MCPLNNERDVGYCFWAWLLASHTLSQPHLGGFRHTADPWIYSLYCYQNLRVLRFSLLNGGGFTRLFLVSLNFLQYFIQL